MATPFCAYSESAKHADTVDDFSFSFAVDAEVNDDVFLWLSSTSHLTDGGLDPDVLIGWTALSSFISGRLAATVYHRRWTGDEDNPVVLNYSPGVDGAVAPMAGILAYRNVEKILWRVGPANGDYHGAANHSSQVFPSPVAGFVSLEASNAPHPDVDSDTKAGHVLSVEWWAAFNRSTTTETDHHGGEYDTISTFVPPVYSKLVREGAAGALAQETGTEPAVDDGGGEPRGEHVVYVFEHSSPPGEELPATYNDDVSPGFGDPDTLDSGSLTNTLDAVVLRIFLLEALHPETPTSSTQEFKVGLEALPYHITPDMFLDRRSEHFKKRKPGVFGG